MENSIEEDIARIKQRIEDVKEYIEYGLPYSEYLDLENSFDNILSDYERVLKENEELKNGTRRNENELEVGIDCDWDALKKALDEAEKTNEYIIYDNEKWIKEKYCVLIQKIKDKIEQYKKILLNCNCFSDVDRIKAINERILELQNLLKNNKN